MQNLPQVETPAETQQGQTPKGLGRELHGLLDGGVTAYLSYGPMRNIGASNTLRNPLVQVLHVEIKGKLRSCLWHRPPQNNEKA